MNKKILIGCVADDFTGASDAASFLVENGLKTILLNGVGGASIDEELCDAVVIALKSRTQNVKDALRDTSEAFDWLFEQGCEHLYFKYCSTFDSTDQGNIGPVVDSLLEKYKQKFTILVPALPINGRIVKNGVLYVNGVKLNETHMRNHPLTPMKESEIAKIMEPQGKYSTLNLNTEMLQKSNQEIEMIIDEFGNDKEHFYVVPDYIDDNQGEKIAEIFQNLKILTGGSGILAPLVGVYSNIKMQETYVPFPICKEGRTLILSGSCSEVTYKQVTDFMGKGYSAYKINPLKLLNGEEGVESIWKFIVKNHEKDILIYSTDKVENVEIAQLHGKEQVSNILEYTTAEIAKKAMGNGWKKIVVAGGETSSAVVQRLNYKIFEIGESVAPGVPIMRPLINKDVRIVLKSGNFGQVDFFDRTIKMLSL